MPLLVCLHTESTAHSLFRIFTSVQKSKTDKLYINCQFWFASRRLEDRVVDQYSCIVAVWPTYFLAEGFLIAFLVFQTKVVECHLPGKK
jgi:hypothetical protein